MSGKAKMPRLRFRRRHVYAVIVAVAVGAFAYDQWFDNDEYFDGKVAIKKDRQRPFQIDPDQPYEISYRRSSPMSGEENEIVIKHKGQVELRASKWVGYREVRTASFTIPPEAQTTILQAVETRRVVKLHRSYIHTDTLDGFHSTLLIRQGEREKNIYCGNHFPENYEKFTKDLDAIVDPYRRDAIWQITKAD